MTTLLSMHRLHVHVKSPETEANSQSDARVSWQNCQRLVTNDLAFNQPFKRRNKSETHSVSPETHTQKLQIKIHAHVS